MTSLFSYFCPPFLNLICCTSSSVTETNLWLYLLMPPEVQKVKILFIIIPRYYFLFGFSLSLSLKSEVSSSSLTGSDVITLTANGVCASVFSRVFSVIPVLILNMADTDRYVLHKLQLFMGFNNYEKYKRVMRPNALKMGTLEE